MIRSTVVPQVEAVLPHGALTKEITLGLQVSTFGFGRKMLGVEVAGVRVAMAHALSTGRVHSTLPITGTIL